MIRIGDKDYVLRLKGTVGLVYLCERQLGRKEPFDMGNNIHVLLLYWNALRASNEDVPGFEDFVEGMTSRDLNVLATEFWAQWNAIEGPHEADDDDNGTEKKSL